MSESYAPDFGSLGREAPSWNARRTLRIAILGDFGAGASHGRLQTGADLGKRKPLRVEFDTLEDAMQRLQLSLTLPLGADGAPVTIELADLDAFHPDAIYARVPLFAQLASLRKRLNQTGQFAGAAAEVTAWAENAGPRASSIARRAGSRGDAPPRGATLDDFARLTGRPSSAPRDDAIAGLLRRVVGPFVHVAASPNKEALVAAVDAGLSDAMRALLHHPDFQNIESLWRGVDFVLRRLEIDHQLQVHLFDVSAEEFAADLSGADDLCETGLYQLLAETPSRDGDGGYTYIAACYQFDATPPHAELLGRAAQIASHANASLLTGINTDPFADRKEPPHRLVREAFASLRELPAASFLGLLGPRFLLRHPYGKKSDPISSFAFEEFSREAGLRGMLWGHPALLALTVLARRGAPLTIDDMPFHHYVDEDGDSVALPCTDRMISTAVGSLLREAGISAVMAHKGEALVRFNGLEAINGDGLAAAGATPSRASGEARFSVQSKIDTNEARADVAFAPTLRKGSRMAPTSEDEPAEQQADNASDDVSAEGSNEAADEPVSGSSDVIEEPAAQAVAAEADAPDGELTALLSSLDEPTTPRADEVVPAQETMDPELAALLKSLG
jgi:type VI secretion system protein ImpC